MSDIIQSLWVGGALSRMERLSITSYLRQGHHFHLYVYDVVAGVPDGTVLCDARSIVTYRRLGEFKTIQNFSDYFRYMLLLIKGGWWVDLDTVCLKPFDFPTFYVFDAGAIGYLKCPQGAPLMVWLTEQCRLRDTRNASWAELGTELTLPIIHQLDLMRYLQPMRTFNPVLWDAAPDAFLDPSPTIDLSQSHAVHLYNEMWRLRGKDKNVTYAPTCLYEQLMRRYGI